MKISIINSKDYIPEKAPETMGSVDYQGRTYEIKGILKKYSMANRIKKFFIFIIPTLITFGSLLTRDKYKNKWSKIVTGKFIQPKFMVAQDRFHILPQSLQMQPSISMERRKELQVELDKNKIDLNCCQPEVLERKNEIDKEAISAFLQKNQLSLDDPYALLLNDIDLITFEQLMNGLKNCCAVLNNLIKKQEYAIGFAPNKSQQWVAELALPYLNHAPISQFSVGVDSLLDHSYQSSLDEKVSNFIMFDDASYSGKQINNKIRTFEEALIVKHIDQPCHLYLVVPFLSSEAKDFISSNANWVKPRLFNKGQVKNLAPNLTITLLTTEKTILSFTDRFKENDLQKIQDFLNEDYRTAAIQFPQALSITEWKIPDALSIHPKLMEDDKIIKKAPPPYKK